MNITKVPCLAFVVEDRACPANSGRIVQVIRRVIKGETIEPFYYAEENICWLIESCGTLLEWNNVKSTRKIFVRRRFMKDANLREIKGDDINATTETNETIKEKA